MRTLILKAEYLGKSDTGVSVHSEYLKNCDVTSTFSKLKEQAINKDSAPFFIDLYNLDESTIIDTIGISEQSYSDVTGEAVMSYDYYQREAQLNQDSVFGVIEKAARAMGQKIPWDENESLGMSALKLRKFRASDHAMVEVNTDVLKHL